MIIDNKSNFLYEIFENKDIQELQFKKYSFIGMVSDSYSIYACQYKEAFERLYDFQMSIDTIIMPTMFLMRHYLELILKYNIQYFSKYSDKKDCMKILNQEHNLEKLADCFKTHWNIVVKKYNLEVNDKEYVNNFKELINIIVSLDKKSMSFRYPKDKDGNKFFDYKKILDVYSLKKSLNKIIPFLEHTSIVFYEQVGWQLEELEEYASILC